MAYFPNGSAGIAFDEECESCKYGQVDRPIACPVWLVHQEYNYTQADKEPKGHGNIPVTGCEPS